MTFRVVRRAAAVAGTAAFALSAAADTAGMPHARNGCWTAAALLAGPPLIYRLARLSTAEAQHVRNSPDNPGR